LRPPDRSVGVVHLSGRNAGLIGLRPPDRSVGHVHLSGRNEGRGVTL
jgi:hypothetical protein